MILQILICLYSTSVVYKEVSVYSESASLVFLPKNLDGVDKLDLYIDVLRYTLSKVTLFVQESIYELLQRRLNFPDECYLHFHFKITKDIYKLFCPP